MQCLVSTMTFEQRARENWLDAFVEYGSYGEAPPRLMWWVGVSTIAACLQRKVFINLRRFHWSPNFYILLVGHPGVLRKSSSIDIGMDLLKQIPDVKMGASSSTWEALVKRIEGAYGKTDIPGYGELEASCLTLALSEFGTFFKRDDQGMVDVLTDMWDGRLTPFEKDTKTNGSEVVTNPWVNMIAATTPQWIARNFESDLVGTGLASRLLVVTLDMPYRDVAYPHLEMPADDDAHKHLLVDRLREIAALACEVELTAQAIEWGKHWYEEERNYLRSHGFGTIEANFIVRKQLHLHKLGMVLAASENALPVVTEKHLQEADKRLKDVEADTKKVFGVVGQTKVTAAARQIVDAVEQVGCIERRLLYRKQFFRTMSSDDFDTAVRCAVQAELIIEVGDITKPSLMARSKPQCGYG